MQEQLTIARPYASAAFNAASESDDVAAWSSLLQNLAAAVSHPEIEPLVQHPRVTNAQLREILSEVLGTQLDAKRGNFIDALLDADRLSLAPEISELFERQKAAAAGVVDVHVESAFELESAEKDKLAEAVRSRLGKDCEVSSTVNADLIGGVVIRVGDSVIDLSLRGRLTALGQRLG